MCKIKSYRGSGLAAGAAQTVVAWVAAPLACSVAISLTAVGRTHAATLLVDSVTGVVINTIPAPGTLANKIGRYTLSTTTRDSNGVPQIVSTGPKTAAYPANNVKDFVGGAGATGLIFSTAAGASINYTAATSTFDSTGRAACAVKFILN